MNTMKYKFKFNLNLFVDGGRDGYGRSIRKRNGR